MDWMYNNPTGVAEINRDGVSGSTSSRRGERGVRVPHNGDQKENLLKVQDVKNDGQINEDSGSELMLQIYPLLVMTCAVKSNPSSHK
jgi:hypothetical protein